MNAARALWVAWLGYVGFVVYGSLLPFQFTPMPLDAAWIQFQRTPFLELGVGERADWVANGVLYLPVGWLTEMLFTRGRRRVPLALLSAAACLFCLTLAVGVEFAQVFFPPRTVSLNDLWAEAIGGLLGVGAARPSEIWWMRRSASFTGLYRWGHRLLEIYLLGYLAFCLFPYDVLLSVDELRDKLASAGWGWWLADHEIGVVRLTLQLALEAVLALPFGFWLARTRAPREVGVATGFAAGIGLGLAIEGAQLFIASGISQGASVLTRALAVPLGVQIWQYRAAWRSNALRLAARRRSGMLGLAYLLVLAAANGWFTAAWHGLAGARGTWAELHFMPFYYHYYTTEAAALLSLTSVAMMYAPVGLLVWIRGGSPMGAALCGLFLCGVVEAGKLFMSGARPDPSNLFIASAACWLVFRFVARIGRADPLPAKALPARTLAPQSAASWQWVRALWILPVAYAVASAIDYPVIPIPLAAGLSLCAALVSWRPILAPALLFAALPALDLAPWSGRYYWDEFDLLLMVCIGTALFRMPRIASRRPSDRLFSFALSLLTASVAISALRALVPWQWPDDNSFYGYFSAFNALRIAKGAAWALLTLALLRRLAERSRDISSSVVAGLTTGLALTVLFVFWERWAFVGLFDFTSDYRVTGPFSSMHTGGAYVECYLAMTAPFAFAFIVRTRQWGLRAIGVALVFATSYAVMVTYSRNGYVALLLAALTFVGLLWRRPDQAAAGHQALLAAAVLGAAALLVAPIVLGPFARERMANARGDLDMRRAHWADALEMRDSSPVTALFGMGLGRFPETHFWLSREPERAATFQLGAEGGNHYLRLGPGSALYVEQIVRAEHDKGYRLSLRLRSQRAGSGIMISLCEKWMLTSAHCAHARFTTTVSGRWEQRQGRLQLDTADATERSALRPLKLALHAPGDSVVDVDDLRLVAEDGGQMLLNGGFESRLDRWFFAADVDLPWHIHSQPVGVLFDQGWIGLLAWGLFLLVALERALKLAQAGNPVQIAATASLVAFVVSGSLNTLTDAPRFLWAVMVLAWLAARFRTGKRAKPARFAQLDSTQP